MDRLTLGVEEEFLVVEAATGDLVPRSDLVLPRARERLGDEVAGELNRCQIEVGTPVCHTLDEVRAALTRLRAGVAAGAAEVGCEFVALGTHPYGRWQDQAVDVAHDRYRRMEEVYRIIARQQVVCGCHVHIGIPDRDLAVAAMNRARPWLPVVLALSANSPYWEGMDSGYDSYRLQVWQRWPTAGMPPRLASADDFDALVKELQAAEAVEDATFLYWYIRPSVRYPTLEFRVCDVCAAVDDAVVVAGLIRALAWTGAQEELDGRPPDERRQEVLEAAMWRAARYGLDGTLVSPGAAGPRPAPEVVTELLDHVRPGLEAHGDWETVGEGTTRIVSEGNGARRQRAAFARRRDPHDVVAWARDG
ncbi:MAG TPA: glutamate--cysteine ligase [Acidimicrobiales bacterium]|nr:glutamate--cysteine ligase [Acidimicrobiales bacterium]